MYRQYCRCDPCNEYAYTKSSYMHLRDTIGNVINAKMPYPIPLNPHENCEVQPYQQNFIKVSFIKTVLYFSFKIPFRFVGFPASANIAPINHSWK